PEALEVMNYNTGKMQKNNDTRANAQYASFNGLVWKKGIDETWLDNGKDVDPDKIVIRYADILLIYAEAKIELNQIDQSVLDAINMVRSRAYGVDKAATDQYPAVKETDQSKLRKIVRLERRMEFAYEGLRYMDLVRWKLASKALSNKSYGLLYPASLLIENVTSKGGWFWPSTPKIDEDGIPDFTEMEKAGQITVLSQRLWDDRQYLWPIPTKEILINKNLKQNPGY
ncbi:RagB/SusD family nutrient uptake outer membrane protein, partial [uncultured Parabacteroides sp.]